MNPWAWTVIGGEMHLVVNGIVLCSAIGLPGNESVSIPCPNCTRALLDMQRAAFPESQ